MSKKLLIFGSVYSPPIGIFKEDIEISYWNYYRPLLKILYSYPKIPVVLFFTGTLLSWIEENHGEFLDVMAEMVKRRQLEILGGAYYAPMLNLISRQDCIGQIELLTTYIRKHFGRRPRGCWITEQIWEPPMPSIIQSAGINYIFLNEYHFWKAGFEERDFHTPCITEDQGKTLVVFPMVHDVYQHFWDMKPDSIRKKIEMADLGRENQVISLIHGIRHDISNSSHTESHLTAVLSELSALIDDNKIELILPHQYLRTRRKLSRGYFPPTSYDEMQAYDSISALENYLHHKGTLTSGVGRTGYYYGSLFRQNLSRYPEVNLMYAKMHFVQRLTAHIRGDKYRKQAAREELWHGQTHAPFWHGEHGGVYVNNYRKEVYAALIRSEKITREQGIFAPSIISLDFDMDGLDEFLYQGNQINAYVHSLGGILFELDFIPSPWNFLDTMGRYPEVYHQSNQEAQGYDTYPRRAFVDHFFTPEATIEQFDRMISEDEGMFSTARYKIESENRSMSKKLIIPFIVEGSLKTKSGIRAIRIQKT
ncbi:MAG: alpha-amylase/4-alpha-glucanotransferase domain-containing protein, partial [Salinispira sp.]